MRRYLLDTGSAGHLIYRRRGVAERVRETTQRGHHVGIAMPVLGELFAGLELSTTRERNENRLRHGVSRLRIWPFDTRAAEEYGRIFATLRRIGRPMQQVDMQVAAIALCLGNCTVVTCDSDLFAVPGLAVENWSNP